MSSPDEPPVFIHSASISNNPRLQSAETEVTNIAEDVGQVAIDHANVANSFETVADKETSDRNIAKMIAMGETTKGKVVEKVDSQTAVLVHKMHGMTERQQEDTLKFNKTAGDYFIDVVMWAGKVLEGVIKTIFQAIYTAVGQIINRIGNAVAAGIRGVVNFFRSLF